MPRAGIAHMTRMKRSVPILVLAAALAATLGGAAQATADPPITTAKKTLIQRIPDGTVEHDGVKRRIGGFAGLEVVGPDAYAIKGDMSGDAQTGWAVLYHVDDFNTPDANTASRTVRMKGSDEPYPMGHTNGLAYHRTPDTDPLEVGSFYVPMLKAVGKDQIAQVNNLGEITKLYKARKGSEHKKIASITYKGGGTWIVGTPESVPDPDDPDVILRSYYTATVVGDHFELDTPFFVPTTTTYNTGQDMYYNSAADQLLVPVWDGKTTEGTPTRRNNRIVVATLGSITEGKVYAPARWIDLSVPASQAALFEFEGLSVDTDGKLFVGSNITHPDGKTWIDGIHKITGR
ncbi:MAG: hypothetical protein ACTH2Q_05875 [Propionibacteriaceae bacterium]